MDLQQCFPVDLCYNFSVVNPQLTMAAKAKVGLNKSSYTPGKPKCTRQGRSKNTNLAASSRNGRKKRYRGQGT